MPFTIEHGDDPYVDELWDKPENRAKSGGELISELLDEFWREQIGIKEGMLLGQIDFMKKALALRFGPLPSWAVNNVDAATEGMIDSWLPRLHTAASIEDVLR